jgi:hypothetical protein
MERMKNKLLRSGLSLLCTALLAVPVALAQDPQAPPPDMPPVDGPQNPAGPPPTSQLMSPEQLDNLVAPIALYPDPLLGQVLAASTYPLEVVQAQQWLQRNGNLRGQALMDAARQENWDPSVQALVAFPDVLQTLNRDVQWTTDLGNAFLAQQKDVMAAVQRMRTRAMQNGKLRSTPQETVTTQNQDGQSAVVIQPADPQVIYVPQYNPVYVWGPPAWGYYPPLWYPSVGFGFGFYPGIYLGGFFPGWGVGWGGWGLGWGWGCGWFGGGLFVNVGFFSHWGYHPGFYGGRFGGGYAWAHDPYHRAGVAYANRGVAARYNNARFTAGRAAAGSNFARSGAAGRYNGGSATARNFSGANRGGSTAGAYRGGSNAGAYRGSNAGGAYRGSTSNSGAYRGPAAGAGRSYTNPGSASRGYSGAQGTTRSYSNPGASRSYGSPAGRSYASPSRSYGGGSSSSPSRSFSSGGSRSSGGGGSRASGGGGRSSGGGRR